jgi:hypothetical protein
MAYSNTYLFGTNTPADDFIREAFERIHITGNDLTPYMAKSAIMSSNLLLTDWMGKGPNSWMRKEMMFSVYPGQFVYQLPVNITQVVDVIYIQPNRLNTGGTPISSGVESGSPANVFNASLTGGCTLNSPNGYIGYNYGTGVQPSIFYVGITPLANNSTYTLSVDYSFDGINWLTLYNSSPIVFNANQTEWFVISNSLNAQYWRVRETGGAVLALQQVYFSQPISNGQGDRTLTALSYTDWMQIANKANPGTLSSYFFNSQISPTLTLWPVSPAQATGYAITYTAYRYPQDIVALTNEYELPQRFLEAMVSDLAYRMACKFTTDENLIARLRADKTDAFSNAATTDETNVPLRFEPDFNFSRK